MYTMRRIMKLDLSNRNYSGLLPTFEIEWNGQLMGHIEQRFALFRPKYDVDFMGWRAEGDFMGWDYDVYEA